MCSNTSSPAPPGKSKRSTPGESLERVARTAAGEPSCCSTHRRISSWSVVVRVSEAMTADVPDQHGLNPAPGNEAVSGLPTSAPGRGSAAAWPWHLVDFGDVAPVRGIAPGHLQNPSTRSKGAASLSIVIMLTFFAGADTPGKGEPSTTQREAKSKRRPISKPITLLRLVTGPNPPLQQLPINRPSHQQQTG